MRELFCFLLAALLVVLLVNQPALAQRSRKAKIPSCRGKSLLFTVPPIPIDDIHYITPLGNLNPSAHTFPTQHLYLHLKREVEGDFSSPTREVDVVAPGKIWITGISSSENLTRDTVDYSVDFSPCRQFKGYFIHIDSLSKKLLRRFSGGQKECSEYETGGERYRRCTKKLRLRLRAGQKIGMKGGSSNGPLDLGARDKRKPKIRFANPRRRRPGLAAYTVCAFDYFNDDVKSRIGELFGDSQTVRTTEPACGTIAQDLPGTAQGQWYLAASQQSNNEDKHLALVHDNVDPEVAVFSVGTSTAGVGLSTGRYFYDQREAGLVNRDFSEIADNQIYCFETRDSLSAENATLNSLAILLQLTSETKLKIGTLNSATCGSGPWSLDSGSVNFKR